MTADDTSPSPEFKTARIIMKITKFIPDHFALTPMTLQDVASWLAG